MTNTATELTNNTTPETPSTSETSTTGDSPISNLITPEPRLWAGKYKSPEELEKAYGNAVNAIRENNELKSKLDTHTKVPDEYILPADLAMRDAEIAEIKAIAKNAGLTQEHFDKMAREMHSRIQSQVESIEKNKQALGQEKLNVLNDYVTKHYPESLRETVLNKLIKDENAMTDALKHRDSLLNSSVPGMSSGSTAGETPKYDGQTELNKAALEYKKNPNTRNRERYIDLARQVSEARFKK